MSHQGQAKSATFVAEARCLFGIVRGTTYLASERVNPNSVTAKAEIGR
mgnify:FL=1|jgi:hypothetical protein